MISAKQSEIFIEAREEAAIAAMQEATVLSDPDYITSWTDGPDESSYSVDDEMTAGLPSDIPVRITTHARPDDILMIVPNNPISALHGAPMPHTSFGMVDGQEDTTVELLPVVQGLLYNESEIRLDAEVWIPKTGGLY